MNKTELFQTLYAEITKTAEGRARFLVSAERLIARVIAHTASDEGELLDMIRTANDQIRTMTIELWMDRNRR
jgi:hypothetical protein